MINTDRTRRVSEFLRRELAMLIAREINDPRIRQISISQVRVSRDLKNATIYFSCMDTLSDMRSESSEKGNADLEKALNHASGFLRHRLGQHADLRVTPALRFRYDESIRRGFELSNLIDRLNRNGENGKV